MLKSETALVMVSEHVVNNNSGEYESYMFYCEENMLDPYDIQGYET